MFVIAIATETSTLASCAETNVMTRNGYQIITENEIYFVSKERFLNKYKGNLYMMPGTKDRLFTFDEARVLRDSIVNLENNRFVKIKGSHRNEIFNKDNTGYNISLSASDVEITARNIRCEYSGNNSNIKIVTDGSVIDATAANSTFNINADNTAITMYVSGCFIDLQGENLEVMVIGNGNIINGIAEGITVFSRGKKNEFHKRGEAPAEDDSKHSV